MKKIKVSGISSLARKHGGEFKVFVRQADVTKSNPGMDGNWNFLKMDRG